MTDVRQERTGWRDLGLSQLHREWGFNCPMLDIDFIALEYNQAKAAALVEYKHERAQPALPSHPSYRALADLGSRAGIPVFGVRYADDYSWFHAVPLNPEGCRWVASMGESFTKLEWRRLLYQLRGIKDEG